MTRARVRGVYATAVTRRLLAAGVDVVQASDPIRRRFDADLPVAPVDALVATTDDRQGVAVSGDADAVDAVAADLAAAGVDAFRWSADAPAGAVYDGVVAETLGGGAVVDLGGGREGYLRYDDIDGYVDDGDRYRVQVSDPAPPWADDRPLVSTTVAVESGLVSLVRGRSSATADVPGDRAAELVRMTDVLPSSPPDGWGVRWERGAADADTDALDAALAGAAGTAGGVEASLADAPAPGAEDPGPVAAPGATEWVWFGRSARFSLDERRREVATTMPGHHRLKAATPAASAAVDFVESACDDPGSFPFDAATRQFGPREGDAVALRHGKPDGRCIDLGRGEVTDRDPDGAVTVRRELSPGGTYDALDTPKEDGDVAVTDAREGRWWYPTAYRGAEGERKGTYVNVCTPVEVFPDAIRYVDLHVDVVRRPDGTVERVDEDELAAAVDDGLVSGALASRARDVADAVENALSDR